VDGPLATTISGSASPWPSALRSEKSTPVSGTGSLLCERERGRATATPTRISSSPAGPSHATYQGGVNLFAKLQDPLIEPLAAQDPIRRSFKEAMEEIVARRPGFRAMAETLLRRCLILVLRRYAASGERRLSWLVELDDEASAAPCPRCARSRPTRSRCPGWLTWRA